jgi:hypothetical protein
MAGFIFFHRRADGMLDVSVRGLFTRRAKRAWKAKIRQDLF